jgi:hypothetical protein
MQRAPLRAPTPTLSLLSLLCGVAAVMYVVWVVVLPHPWPSGESGLIAVAAALIWTVAFPLVGLTFGGLSLSRGERPKSLVWTALLANAAVIAAFVVTILG